MMKNVKRVSDVAVITYATKRALMVSYGKSIDTVIDRCILNAGLVKGKFIVNAALYVGDKIVIEYASVSDDLPGALYKLCDPTTRKEYVK